MKYSEWNEYTIGESCELLTGFAFKSKEYLERGKYRVVRGDNVKTGFIYWEEKSRFWDVINEKLEKYTLNVDDIVIGMDGSRVGKNRAVIQKKDLPAVLAQRVACLRAKNGVFYQEYINHIIMSSNFEKYIESIKTGTSIPHISLKQISGFKFNAPKLEEQIEIASILSSLDKKIELNNEMNKILEEMTQALFKRWFIDFEFPNEDGEPYKSSGGEMIENELRMIPKGWKYGVFNDISEKIYSGGTPKTSEGSYWNGELSWMSSGETRNNFVTNTEKSITRLGAEKSSTKLANKYDTVIASAGQGFTRGQTSLLLIDTYINQSLIAIKSNECFKLFNHINIKMRYDELRAISDSHSIRGSLTTKMISALSTVIPEKEILLKFNKIVEPLIVKIENNINNTNELIELRDSLLPKLMSGKVILEDIKVSL